MNVNIYQIYVALITDYFGNVLNILTCREIHVSVALQDDGELHNFGQQFDRQYYLYCHGI